MGAVGFSGDLLRLVRGITDPPPDRGIAAGNGLSAFAREYREHTITCGTCPRPARSRSELFEDLRLAGGHGLADFRIDAGSRCIGDGHPLKVFTRQEIHRVAVGAEDETDQAVCRRRGQ